MSEPLRNPPVYYMVAQVKFNSLLKLKEFLPDIQEGLGKLGYPGYRSETVLAFHFGPQGQEGPVRQDPVERFIFDNIEQTQNFLLGNDALAFQSTRYGHFEQFLDTFLNGLGIVHKTASLAFTERVGLRYLDRVVARPDETLGEYLTAEVLGLGAKLDAHNVTSYAETRAERAGVRLVSRVVIQTGPVGFPADIGPVPLVVEPRFRQESGRHAVLDNDGFIERREAFSLQTVGSHFAAIHALIDEAFRKTATEHAFKTWS